MNSKILNAIKLIEGLENNSNNFGPTYLFSTENISGFSQKITFKNKKILSVCSSGDQVFNMILNDAQEIDLFDINIFSKYYFRLKESAIQTLDYNEFLDFFTYKKFDNTKLFNLDSYLKIRKKIKEEEIKHFWDYLFCHYPGNQIYNSNLFFNKKIHRSNYIKCNDYLKNEENYNKLKEKIKNKTFNFYNINLFKDNLPNNKKYDFVYLSNIFDYLYIEDTLEYANKIKDIILEIKKHLNNNGEIAISYLYFYYDDYYINNLNSFWIRKKILKDATYIVFPGASSPNSNQLRNKDALMLCKK